MRVTYAAIATSSHLHAAAVLADSLVIHSPAHRRALLWVDAPDDAVADEVARAVGFDEVLHPRDVLEPAAFASMRERYTVPELCFALKPVLIRHLLRGEGDLVAYVDTDILVCAPLDPLLDAHSTASILLTPHLLVPLPEDERWPRDVTILAAGAFNLGFVAVRRGEEGMRFLDWWAERERSYGYLDPSGGLGADQKWCDLVPALFPGAVAVRSLGANVGYWNLPARPLTLVDGEWRAGGERLLFFHFSGFDPRRPHELSRHQDRIDAASQPPLALLLRTYADLLLDKRRHLESALPQWVRERGAPAPAAEAAFDSLDRFLPLHGRAFVAQAYRTLLRREPDAAGLRAFSTALTEGRLSRWQVLGRLRWSREGRSCDASVRGLMVGYALATLYRVPVAGPAAALLARTLGAPLRFRDLAGEDRLMAQCFDTPGDPLSEREALLARLRSRRGAASAPD